MEKILVENKKVNKLLPNITMDTRTEMNEQIYAVAKLVSDKISVPQRNLNRKPKPGRNIRLERQINKPATSETAKEGKHSEEYVSIKSSKQNNRQV